MQKSKLQFKIEKVILFSLFSFLFSAFPVSAISFSVSPQDLTAGKETTVVLSLDTGNQEINAVELRLKFSPDDFFIKDASDGNSIINLWIDKPNFSNPPAGGQVKGGVGFSGIIPGGFRGNNAQLAQIILIPKKAGEAGFEIAGAKVLLNDGKGTEADIKISNLKFNVTEVQALPVAGHLPAKDTEPPEAFTPQIARDPNLFGGKYFLVFATQDKGSGVDYYAIHESTRIKKGARIATNEWVVSESPYLLKDQKLNSYIYVKAVDKAGNERIAVLPAQNHPGYADYFIYAIIIPIVIIIYRTWRILWKKEKSQDTREKSLR